MTSPCRAARALSFVPCVALALVLAHGASAGSAAAAPPATQAAAAVSSEATSQAVSPGASPSQTAATIADLAFLEGGWVADDGARRVEERWLCAGPDGMLGVGRTTDLAKGKTVFFEYLRIEARRDGLFYVAQPRGGPATEFRLVRIEEGTAVFENPAHDFPKRVVYARRADGGLTARVEGDAGSPGPAEEFRYRPAGSCPRETAAAAGARERAGRLSGDEEPPAPPR